MEPARNSSHETPQPPHPADPAGQPTAARIQRYSKRQFVRDITPGDAVADCFVVASARQGTARNGPFWTLSLQDVTGALEAKIWSPLAERFPTLAAGRIARVEGRATAYRDKTQLNIDKLQFVDPLPPSALDDAENDKGGAVLDRGDKNCQPGFRDDNFCNSSTTEAPGLALVLDMKEYVPAAEEQPEVMLARLEELCRQNLHYPPWRKFVKRVLEDPAVRSRLLTAPGAKAMHHAYLGGLLEHTLGVVGLCLKFCDQYPQLDREVLLAAACFHDLGKAWELSGGLANDYTDVGRLVGHIQIGLEILEPHLRAARLPEELVVHFKHLILSHHGQHEYGSPKTPMTAEAFALHYADNMDAKMNQVQGALAPLGEGAEACAGEGGSGDTDPVEPITGWSAFQRGLDRYLFKPRPTPGVQQAARPAARKEDQCSLPLKA